MKTMTVTEFKRYADEKGYNAFIYHHENQKEPDPGYSLSVRFNTLYVDGTIGLCTFAGKRHTQTLRDYMCIHNVEKITVRGSVLGDIVTLTSRKRPRTDGTRTFVFIARREEARV